MATLELSEKTRVLHAALHLTSFTVKRLVELTGVKENTVQTVIARSKELLEEAGPLESGKPGARAMVYRFKRRARAKLSREAVDLAEKLRGPVVPDTEETVRRAETALEAVDSTLALGRIPPGDEEHDKDWRERAQLQLKLSRELVSLVPDVQRRALLDLRLTALESRIDAPALRRARAAVRPNDWLERLQSLASAHRLNAAFAGIAPPQQQQQLQQAGDFHADEASAPALIFETGGEHELPDRLGAALDHARHPVLQLSVRDILGELQQPAGREGLLHVLETRPNSAVYVTLDSRQQDSRGMVEGLLGVLEECLWDMTEQRAGAMVEVTLIDVDISSTLLRKVRTVRNLSYYPNVHSPASIDTVIQGFVGDPMLSGRFQVDGAIDLKKSS